MAVLRSCAAVLRISRPADRAVARADLDRAIAVNRLIAVTSYRQDIVEILAEPDDAAAVEVGRTLLSRRTIGATIGVTGRLIASAAAADARPVWARVLGRQLPETGVADRVYSETTAVSRR